MVDDLYQEIILDHGKRPRNFHADGRREPPRRWLQPSVRRQAEALLKMEGDVVKDASFVGSGCAISTASASLMTETLKGKSRAEALKLLDKFHHLLTTDTPVAKDLGKLVVFCGVRDYPARVKCATLAWHTLQSALEDVGGDGKHRMTLRTRSSPRLKKVYDPEMPVNIYESGLIYDYGG